MVSLRAIQIMDTPALSLLLRVVPPLNLQLSGRRLLRKLRPFPRS